MRKHHPLKHDTFLNEYFFFLGENYKQFFFFFFSECRSISSEVSSDLIIQVKGSRYLLHKVKLGILLLVIFKL